MIDAMKFWLARQLVENCLYLAFFFGVLAVVGTLKYFWPEKKERKP